MWRRAIWLGLMLASPAFGETRALLVGVSHYDESIGLTSLRGPANDVRLLHQVLTARGVGDVTVLADGIAGGAVPTHAAIVAGMAELARKSRPGDLAIVTLSGHGTRQADQNGDETDGLDEVFLPADTGRAEAGARGIPNALIDDEIGDAVLAIRATGADVWLVIDSCNSGSGLRGGSLDVVSRWVDPALLGVAAAEHADGGTLIDIPPAGTPLGHVVAFYAARSSEVALEVNLTPDQAGNDGWYGLFSSRLAARLQTGGTLSYRQLFQGVLADMNDAAVPGGARMQTPGWEGDMIDAGVLGGSSTVGLRQYAVTEGSVAAGLVQGLGNGTLLALVRDAGSSDTLAFAQMEGTGPTQAMLRMVAADCTPQSAELCPAIGDVPPQARFARLVARPLDLLLRLAPPRDFDTGLPLPADAGPMMALQQAMATLNAGREQVVIDPQRFDVDVAAKGGVLWFGRKVAIGAVPVGLSWALDGTVPLSAVLQRMARAEQLAAMLRSIAGGGSALDPAPVSIRAEVLASRAVDLSAAGVGQDAGPECRRAQRAVAQDPFTPLDDASDLKQCDQVRFQAQGTMPGVWDVNRIHIDAQFCVHAAHALVEDDVAPTSLGPKMTMCSDCPGGYSAGDEQLFVIVTQSGDNADPVNLEGLLETCSPASATRGTDQKRASDMLTALARRPDMLGGLRGGFGGLDITNVWVTPYHWQVVPKQVAFAEGRRTSP